MRHDSLRAFQTQHRLWLEHNFPEQEPLDGLLGMMEELGELCHALLKAKQGIRGYTEEEFRKQAEDAIGDIFIYAASFCNSNGFDLAACLENAWEEVSDRDWQAYPESGRPAISQFPPPATHGEGNPTLLDPE